MFRKHDVVRLRTRLGLTQEKFAEELGVSTSIVVKWERGSHKPSSINLHALEVLAKLSRGRVTKR